MAALGGSFKSPPPAGIHSPTSPSRYPTGNSRPEVVRPHYTSVGSSGSHSRSRRSHSRHNDGSARRSRSRRSSRSRSRSRSRSHGRHHRRDGGHYSHNVEPHSDGYSYTKGPTPTRSVGSSGRQEFPSFDQRDRAPEDRHRGAQAGYSSSLRSSETVPNPHNQTLVRGSLRLEGVDFSKYEGLKEQPDLQRMLTTALRDDLISEGGNGMTREDILLRLSPGPIRTVVLDYHHSGDRRSGSAGKAPSLVDAEWCMDVEYAISTRSEQAQANIAHALYDSLSSGRMHLKSTRNAYVRYIHPEAADPHKIQAVPTTTEDRASSSESPLTPPQYGHGGHHTYYSPQGTPSRNIFADEDRYASAATTPPRSYTTHYTHPAHYTQDARTPTRSGYYSGSRVSPQRSY
eukprot:Rhum_TRINITY_DN17149_c0_g1::Rhum_TRINITY_DN17149_c0_g1_i1::g.165372::m.165372